MLNQKVLEKQGDNCVEHHPYLDMIRTELIDLLWFVYAAEMKLLSR